MGKVVLEAQESQVQENQGIHYAVKWVDDSGNDAPAPENIAVTIKINDFNGVEHEKVVNLNGGANSVTLNFSEAYDNKTVDENLQYEAYITKAESIVGFGQTHPHNFDNTHIITPVTDYQTITHTAVVSSGANEDQEYLTFTTGFWDAQVMDSKVDSVIILDITKDGQPLDSAHQPLDSSGNPLTINADGYYEVPVAQGSVSSNFKIKSQDSDIYVDQQTYTARVVGFKNGSQTSQVDGSGNVYLVGQNSGELERIEIDKNLGSTAKEIADTKDEIEVSVIAVNADGTPLDESKIPEGDIAYYKVQATATSQSGDVRVLGAGDGKVDVEFSNGTAQSDDYEVLQGVGQTLVGDFKLEGLAYGSILSAKIIDDYLKDGGETFTIIPTNARPADSTKEYEDHDIVYSGTTTTITDGSDESDGGTSEKDTVYVQLVHDDTKAEGDSLTHTVKLVDKDGNDVTVPTGKSVTVNLTYNADGSDTATKGVDYTAVGSVTISGGESSTNISIPAIDDYLAEGSEKYTITLGDISQSENTFENVAQDTNHNKVTGTITDGSDESDGGTSESDTVTIKLVPTDKDGNVLDESKVKEGEKAYYKALLVDKDGNVISDDGTVDISFTDESATGGSDYDNSSKTVQLGEVFEVPALEDYEDEPDEKYKASASNFSHTSAYEHVTYDATVETTIENVHKEKPYPIDLSDDCTFVKQGESKIIKVLENDSGKDLLITSVEQPEHGTVEIVGDGRCLKYTADPAPETCSSDTDTDIGASRKSKDAPFLGTDSFTYTVVDAYGKSDTSTVNPHIASSTDSRDIYRGDDKSEFIIAGKGNDYLSGGAGNDKYFFSKGDGDDIIVDSSGDDDRVVFTRRMDSSDTLCFKLESDGDLVISYGEDHEDHITVKYQKQLKSIERIEMDDESYLNSNDLDKIIQVLSASANGGDSDFMSLSSINDKQSQECQICWHEGW